MKNIYDKHIFIHMEVNEIGSLLNSTHKHEMHMD